MPTVVLLKGGKGVVVQGYGQIQGSDNSRQPSQPRSLQGRSPAGSTLLLKPSNAFSSPDPVTSEISEKECGQIIY